MKKFLILINGQEGTSSIIWLLNNFNSVTAIHKIDGWEPFDEHNCGPITATDFEKCFRLIYTSQPKIDFESLNKIYQKTGIDPLVHSDKSGLVGMKMRPFNFTYLHSDNNVDITHIDQDRKKRHLAMLKSLLKECGVKVFFSVRRNSFKRALSRYHNAIPKEGHHNLQFQVADGTISLDKIEKIRIDPMLFNFFIRRCIDDISLKRNLMEEFRGAGIEVFPMVYEDFVNDPLNFFSEFFRRMEEEISPDEIMNALEKGTPLKRVHVKDISHYVTNHHEITEKFKRYDVLDMSIH